MATLQEWAVNYFGTREPEVPGGKVRPVVEVPAHLQLLLPTGNMQINAVCCTVHNGKLRIILGRGVITSIEWFLNPDGATLVVEHGDF